MMKKILFSAAVVAVTLSSCSKNEVVTSIDDAQQAVSFGTYVGNATTKAEIKEAFEAGDNFGVFGYYTEAADYAGATKPNFMFNQSVVKNADGSWSYSPIKYWPNSVTSANDDGKVSFFAYWPTEVNSTAMPLVETDGVTAFTKDSQTDPCVKYTLDQANAVDLMWAVNNSTGLPFLNETKQATGEKISFQFKHALARVGFQVTLADEILNAAAAGTTVTINSIEFGGTISGETFTSTIYGDAVLNLNNTTANAPLWTAGTTKANLKLEAADFTNNGVFSYSATAGAGFDATMTNLDGSYFMVIPQDLSSAKMRITYTVSTVDAALSGGKIDVVNKYVSDLQDFVSGKAYLYKYEIGLNTVKVEGEVTAWPNTSDDVDVPVN